MRVLSDIEKPSSEQLKIVSDYRPGFTLIRGAAGSGKTTTGILRLKFVTGVWQRERRRRSSADPVRVLVLTYNRTLRGYVAMLVDKQAKLEGVDVTLSTFAHWAWEALGRPEIAREKLCRQRIWALGGHLDYSREFLADEVDYVLGRFRPARVGDYANQTVKETYKRRGRGTAPRVDLVQRKRLLKEVIEPYRKWKHKEGLKDWGDIAIEMAQAPRDKRYDIVLVDEAQDFSANQLRAVTRHLAKQHSTTFVLDAMQQIYPRGFSWREVDVDIEGQHSYRLTRNYRNTRQIAAFARPLVDGLPVDDDGTLPDFDATEEEGPLPVVVRGLFNPQMDWVIAHINDLPEDESVVLLHARGGKWLDTARRRLKANGTKFVDMTRNPEWPEGVEQVGFSTMHSAKGLEFDHVVILGLNADLLPHGEEENDTQLINHRRLLAMAIGRARRSVTLSFKPAEASKLVEYLKDGTYEVVDV